MLDLLRVSVESGLSLAAALGEVGERTTGPLALEWRAVGREAAYGVPLSRSLARLVESLLNAHSQIEEQLLVEPLDHCLEQIGHRETFHQEHKEIDEALARAQTARTLKQARACLLAAVVSSRRHFDKEERIVFPLAEKLLKSRTLTQLWDTWVEQRDPTVR